MNRLRIGALLFPFFLALAGCSDDDNGGGTAAVCGNAIQETGEQCDTGPSNSDTVPDACRTDCTTAGCGDNVIDSGEQCDNGTANSDTAPNACRTSCTTAGCGDSVIDTGEDCDDGNTNTGDGCDETCQSEDPCFGDNGPAVTSSASYNADLLTALAYSLTFDEPVNIAQSNVSIALATGTGTPGSVTLTGNVATYALAFDASGWIDGDTYEVTIDTGVTNTSCGTAMAADFVLTVTVTDPCAGDDGPAVTSATTHAGFITTPLPYTLTFDEDVVILGGDLTFALNAGTGTPGAVTLTGTGDTFTVTFDSAGWVDADIYDLTIAAAVANVSCGTMMQAAFTVTVTASATDPCAGDPGPMVDSLPVHDAFITAPPPYALTFDEPVNIAQSNVSIALATGTGTPGSVTLTGNVATYALAFDASGWIDGDTYEVTIDTGVTNTSCGTAMAADFVLTVNAIGTDPCATDPGPSVVSDTTHVAVVAAPADYVLVFDEPVDFVVGDLSFTLATGTGTAGMVSVSGGPTDFAVGFDSAGWVDGDTYDLVVGTTVTNLSCSTALPAAFTIAVSAVAGTPTPLVCGGAEDYAELEEFAYTVAPPAVDATGNTNGVAGTPPFNLSNAENTSLAIDTSVDQVYQVAGLIEHFDPATLEIEASTDAFLIGPLTNVTGRQIDFTIDIDGSHSGAAWGQTGFIDLVVFDTTGNFIGVASADLLTAGGTSTASIQLRESDGDFSEGDSLVIALGGAADAVPGAPGEYLDYCIEIRPRLQPPRIVINTLDPIYVPGTTTVTFDVTFNEGVDGVAANATVDNGTLALTTGGDGDAMFSFDLSGMTDGTVYTLSFGSGITNLAGTALDPIDLVTEVFAPPTAGGTCANSVDLTSATFPYVETGYLNMFATDATGGGTCQPTAYNPYFFHYTPAAGGLYDVSVAISPMSSAHLRVAAFTGGCDNSSNTELDCQTDFGTGPINMAIAMTSGETYYFVAYADGDYDLQEPTVDIAFLPPAISSSTLPSSVPAGTGSVTFDVTFNQAVQNVNTTNVTVDNSGTLTLDGGVDPTYTFTLSNMADDTTYTVTFGAGITSTGGAALDPAPQTLTVRQAAQGELIPPPNSEGVVDLNADGVWAGNVLTYTPVPAPVAPTGDDTTTMCAPSGEGPEYLYQYVVQNDVPVLTFDTNGSVFDTVLNVFDGHGGGVIDCDDDGGSGARSLVSLSCASAGEGFFLTVHGYAGDWLDGDALTINVTESAGSVMPAIGAVGVDPAAALVFDLGATIDTTVGVIQITGDAGFSATYDLATSPAEVVFSGANSVMTITPATAFGLGEVVTATFTGIDVACGLALTPTWSFTTWATGPTELFREEFPDAAALAGWTLVAAGCAPWIHSTDNTCTTGRDNWNGWDGISDGNYAISDSDCAGPCAVDSELISASFATTGFTIATLGYGVALRTYSGVELLDVDVSLDGSAWTNVATHTADTAMTNSVDISTIAGNQATVYVRFHYHNVDYDYFAMIDDVVVTGLP